MKDSGSNSYNINTHIIVNSIFTKKQIDIISKRLITKERPKNITSGAYYRQVKQCREKLRRLLYSLVLLRSIGVIDNNAFLVIERMSEQLSVMFTKKNSDIPYLFRSNSVTFTIDELIRRMNPL